MLLFGADAALIRRAAPATFSRKREKGFAPSPPIARREMGVFRRPMAPREDWGFMAWSFNGRSA